MLLFMWIIVRDVIDYGVPQLSTSTPSRCSCPSSCVSSIRTSPAHFSRRHPRAQDTDRSGTIGFNEFSGLWKYIKDWQNVYRHFDRDRSGSIDAEELKQALHQFGYSLSPQLLHLVEAKYGE